MIIGDQQLVAIRDYKAERLLPGGGVGEGRCFMLLGRRGKGGREERKKRMKEEEDANLCIYQNIFHRSCRSLLVHHHHEMLGEVRNNLFPLLCASSHLLSGVWQGTELE